MRDEAAAAGRERQDYWDAVRGLLMLLGIPFHAALAYVPTFDWVVSDPERTPVANAAYHVIHAFRMADFFIVAGYFAAMMLERGAPGRWLRARLGRLGIPLLFGTLLINPLQAMIGQVGRQVPGSLDPAAAWAGTLRILATPGEHWVEHLWFLTVLLYYALGAAAVARAVPAAATLRRDDLGLHARSVVPAVVAAATLIGLYETGVRAMLRHAPLGGPAADMLSIGQAFEYLPYFLLGAMLGRCRGLLDQFTRPSALACAALPLAFATWAAWPATRDVARAAVAILMAQVMLSTARTFLDRPIPAVRRLAEASFVIYLVHMPIVEALAAALFGVPLVPEIKWLLVSLATLPASYGVYRLVIANRWTNLAFNGVVPRAETEVVRPRVAVAD